LLRLAYLGMTFANQRGQLLAAKASRSADEVHTVKDNYASESCRWALPGWLTLIGTKRLFSLAT
jgi:hypothetical protein